MTAPDPWYCAVCGRGYVVTSLARRCEAKHEEQDDGEGAAPDA